MKLIIGLIKVWDVKTDLGAPGHPQQRDSDGERHAQGITAKQFPRGSGLCWDLDTPQKQIPLNKTHSTVSSNSPGKKMLILTQLRCLFYDVGCIMMNGMMNLGLLNLGLSNLVQLMVQTRAEFHNLGHLGACLKCFEYW